MDRYKEWIKASKALQAAKQEELRLRLLICTDLLNGKEEGQMTMAIDGYKIVPKAVLNRTVNEEVLKTVWDKLTDEEKDCIQYVPKVVDSKIRKYEEHGGLILEAIITKPGLPQLKIEEM